MISFLKVEALEAEKQFLLRRINRLVSHTGKKDTAEQDISHKQVLFPPSLPPSLPLSLSDPFLSFPLFHLLSFSDSLSLATGD